MTDDKCIQVAEGVHLSLYYFDDTEEKARPWTVSGDLRKPGTGWDDDSNYDCRDAMETKFTDVEFDPESGQFYAYCATSDRGLELIATIIEWLKTHHEKTTEEAEIDRD